jgi:tetratricopeptide (TPR) repeat protein
MKRPARIFRFEPTYHFTDDLPPGTHEKLKAIFANWTESEKAEALVQDIIDQSPDTLGVRIVAYRFYFYRRRPEDAARWALSCLEWLSQRLKLPADWREVTPEMADFAHWHAFPRLWLQSLTAYSYNLARLGQHEASLAALAKVEELDPLNHLGAADLREVFIHPAEDAGMVFDKAF